MNTELITRLRPTLKNYAYNICGSAEDAEDVVQDVLLKFLDLEQSHIEDAKSYLIRMVINCAINQKKKLKKQVLNYPGEWLPEPMATESADAGINRKELLSYSLMVLLEKLNPRQRAVYILKEAFDYDHAEIAAVLDIKPDLSRQLLTRAKKSIGDPKELTGGNVPESFLTNYINVLHAGDMNRLEAMLNEDIVSISDGGGKARAAINPVHGKKSVAALLQGLYTKFYEDAVVRHGLVNQQPALFYYLNGVLAKCMIFTIKDGQVISAYIIRNPDKLKNLN
ncbi:sigma-70 family RNA polymerase sigma factor [Pedobacter hiemivivus]|uniref:Sigma-70 family RNA polymerase sigma factor n=1 Tax=Pedobacter hiemivivus TaxID=2530454 RepID=A0A4U1GLK0_9SPHI|nr:sigma-70 family RNA polymerase sigma factor [Pedobacter hiemivivus]TKC63890.1 sigma-70 family RNA polymerase sigma factor [Pedobacter hiemivivus]